MQGYCVYSLAELAYYALYPPVISLDEGHLCTDHVSTCRLYGYRLMTEGP